MDDNFNQMVRPTSVKVNLLAIPKVQEKTVNVRQQLGIYILANLPKYKSGQEITYTATEEAVDGYNGYNKWL